MNAEQIRYENTQDMQER